MHLLESGFGLEVDGTGGRKARRMVGTQRRVVAPCAPQWIAIGEEQ